MGGGGYWSSVRYLYLQEHCNVSLSKEVLESIEELLTKKAKTAESCVETSDEDDNYNNNNLSSTDLSGADLSADNLSGDELLYRERFHLLHSFVNKVIIY